MFDLVVVPGAQLLEVTLVVKTTATITAAVATVSAVAGAAAAGDAQTLAVLGSLSCAPPSEKKQTSSLRYMLSPFVDLGYQFMLLGNLGLVALVILVQCITMRLLLSIGSKKRSLIEVAAMVQFPTFPYTVTYFLYQGTVFASFNLAVKDSSNPGSVVLGICGIVLTALLPVCSTYYFFVHLHDRILFLSYNFTDVRWFHVPFLPCGYWDSNDINGIKAEFRRRFGRMLGSFRSAECAKYHVYPLVSIFVFNLAASLLSLASCDALYISLMLVMLASVAFVVFLRPHRSMFLNASSAAGYIVLFLVCVLQYAASRDVASDHLPIASAAVSMLQLVVIVSRSAYDIALMILHSRWRPSTADEEPASVTTGDLSLSWLVNQPTAPDNSTLEMMDVCLPNPIVPQVPPNQEEDVGPVLPSSAAPPNGFSLAESLSHEQPPANSLFEDGVVGSECTNSDFGDLLVDHEYTAGEAVDKDVIATTAEAYINFLGDAAHVQSKAKTKKGVKKVRRVGAKSASSLPKTENSGLGSDDDAL